MQNIKNARDHSNIKRQTRKPQAGAGSTTPPN